MLQRTFARVVAATVVVAVGLTTPSALAAQHHKHHHEHAAAGRHHKSGGQDAESGKDAKSGGKDTKSSGHKSSKDSKSGSHKSGGHKSGAIGSKAGAENKSGNHKAGKDNKAGSSQGAPAETVRIGSYNVKFNLPDATALDTALRAMREYDIAGLQEWTHRGNLSPAIRHAGYGLYHPHGSDVAIVWRSDKYKLVKSYAVKLVDSRFVGGERGRKISGTAPARQAAVATLVDRTSGKQVSLVNVHLPAHIESHGRPNPLASRARIAHHEAAEHATARIVDHLSETVWNVFMVGDTNVDYHADAAHRFSGFPVAVMGGVGFRSSWTGYQDGGRGTHEGRLIDQVFAETLPLSAQVLPGGWASDHNPLVAVYRLR